MDPETESVERVIPEMGVSKNRGTPKWMIYMEIPIKMDDNDLGVPPFSETPKRWLDGKR